MIQLSNARTEAIIEDWPHGRQRVAAKFEVESNKKGERLLRTTTGKPKASTYYEKIRIVDGDDGKTYGLASTIHTDMIVRLEGNLRYTATFWPDNDEYNEYKNLLDAS